MKLKYKSKSIETKMLTHKLRYEIKLKFRMNKLTIFFMRTGEKKRGCETLPHDFSTRTEI